LISYLDKKYSDAKGLHLAIR